MFVVGQRFGCVARFVSLDGLRRLAVPIPVSNGVQHEAEYQPDECAGDGGQIADLRWAKQCRVCQHPSTPMTAPAIVPLIRKLFPFSSHRLTRAMIAAK